MFKGFIEWLDDYVDREEPSSILKSLIGLLAFAGLLGTIFGSQVIRAAAFAAVTLFTVSVILFLVADRRRLKAAYNKQLAQTAEYCDALYRGTDDIDPHILVESWRQTVFVSPNGDTKEVLDLKFVVLRENLRFLRLTASSRWDQPQKHRRDVKVIARNMTASGAPGTRWNVTTTWSGQKLVLISHFREPVSRGDQFAIELIRTWPAKCRPLMRRGEAEDFLLVATNRLWVQHVEYKVVLPVGFDAIYELIGTKKPNVQMTADTQQDPEGRKAFTWRTESVPTMTRMGFRLELC